MERETNSKFPESLICLIIITAAFLLRILGLGAASLTMNEAANALTASGLFAKGSGSPLLYTLPTALIFSMFRDAEFTARMFPALAGIMLSAIPLFLRDRLGSRKAFLLAALFALDPVLLFWSKRADALIPSMAFAGAALAFFLNRKPAAALCCLFMALGGGDRSVPALILFSLCGAAVLLLQKSDLRDRAAISFSKKDLGLTAGISALFIALFGIFPGGIGSCLTGIFAGFSPAPTWAYPGITAVLAALIIYAGIPLLLFAAGCIRKRRLILPAVSAVGMAALLLWRGILALPWISVFLWTASADLILEAAEILKGRKGFPFWAAAGTVTGAYAFFYFRLVEVFNQQNGDALVQISWNGTAQTLPLTRTEAAALLTLVSVLIIVLIVKILLGFSDSVPIRAGILCGALMAACWGLCTNIWNTGGFDRIGDHPASFHMKNSMLLLNGDYTAFSDTPLQEILDEMILKHGDSSNTEYGLNLITDDPLLEWLLRKQKGIRTDANTNADLSGIELIVAPSGISYADMGFAGTVLPYRSTIRWERLSLIEWGKWLIFGDGPAFTDPSLTLWVRGDYVFSN